MGARLLVTVAALMGAFAAGAVSVQLGVLPPGDSLPMDGGPVAPAPAAAPSVVPIETPRARPAPEADPRGFAGCSDVGRITATGGVPAVAQDPCPPWLEVMILRLAMGRR
jgi:hypothetical protein